MDKFTHSFIHESPSAAKYRSRGFKQGGDGQVDFNRQMSLLNELGGLLQTCLIPQEAYAAVTQIAQNLFPKDSGAVFLLDPSRNRLEMACQWGDSLQSENIFPIEDCLALRRGHVHLVTDLDRSPFCRHLKQPVPGMSLCIPMMAQNEAVGLFHSQAPMKIDVEAAEAKKRLAVAVADHLGLALTNLKLIEKLRSRTIREQDQRQGLVKAEHARLAAVEELRALAHHLQSIREEEKIRIARELHDELGHSLTALKMDLAWLESGIAKTGQISPRQVMLEKARSMSKLIDTTIDHMRKIVSELRPSVLDHLGLTAAIEWQVMDFQNRTGIKCFLQSSQEDMNLGKDLNTALFRVFQEVMTNVARHSNAKNVDIRIERKNGLIQARISDDGKGIPAEHIAHPRSFGLMGMRERVVLLGGEIAITGQPQRGTTVLVKIPFSEATEGENHD